MSNVTIGAGMILGPAEAAVLSRVTPEERAARFGQQAVTLWIEGEGRIDLAYAVERKLFDLGYAAVVLDDERLSQQASPVAEQINRAGVVCLSTLEGAPEEAFRASAGNSTTDDLLLLLKRHGVLSD